MSILDGFFSLGTGVNTLKSSEDVNTAPLAELELDMSDEDIISVTNDWTKLWEQYEPKVKTIQEQNELYWLGQQFQEDGDKLSLVDNLIFESLETFLPIATRPKPDPLVEGGKDEYGRLVARKTAKMLAYIADINAYNLVLRQVTRFWALHLLGCTKVGWSTVKNEITCAPVRVTKLILDPQAIVEGGKYIGEFLGEKKAETASKLIARFPEVEKYIRAEVDDKMGTKMEYVEWWTPEYVCWIHVGKEGKKVLKKTKNPHWNYDTEQPVIDPATGQPMLDQMGQPMMQTVKGRNHFPTPEIPYLFLSIFSLGRRPHDETSLISQNISLQDLINLRLRQINKNAGNANGGIAVSGDVFDKEQAEEAANTIRGGGAVWVPSGSVSDAIQRLNGQPLPDFIYQSLLDYRNELRNVFGVRGSSPEGIMGEKTVRGKYAIREQDTSRIGGGISTFLEAHSDAVFNYWVQLMYVYYDTAHEASVIGEGKEEETVSLVNSEFRNKLNVGVKEGSMIPHDPMSERNEAVDLWAAGALDPITLGERLDMPNPKEFAMRLVLWKMDPISLFPELAAQRQPEGPPPPSRSMQFKDLPPEGQIQMAAQGGIQLSPEAVMQQKIEADAKEQQQRQDKLAALDQKRA